MRVVQFGHVVKVHPIPGADHHQRRSDDGDEREELDDFAGLVGRHVQIHLQDAGERIGVALREFADVKERVINVAVIWHHVRADELEFAVGKARKHFALRADDLAQMQHFFFDLEDFVERVLVRMLQRHLLQFTDFHGEFVQRGFVIVH